MWTREMKKKLTAARRIAEELADSHYETPPDIWDELVPNQPEKWESLLGTLDPKIVAGEKHRSRVMDKLRRLLPKEKAQKLLLEYDEAYGHSLNVETTAAFLLGIAIGQRAAGLSARK